MLMHVRTALLISAIAMPTALASAQMDGADNTPSPNPQQHRHGQPATASDSSRDSTRTETRPQGTEARQAERGDCARAGSQKTQSQLVEMIAAGNQAEIELAQLAEERAQNSAVRTFAQQMRRDHQQFSQQLQTATGRQAKHDDALGQKIDEGGLTANAAERDATRGDRQTAIRTDRDDAAGGMGSSVNRYEADDRAVATADAAATSARAHGGATDAGAVARDRDAMSGTDRDAMAGAAGAELNRTDASTARANTAGDGDAQVYGYAVGERDGLAGILHEVHQQHLQSTRQMLSEKQGSDFDKAYIGTQISMHQAMRDKLEVFSRHVDSDTRQVFEQGRQAVEHHLEQAKKIMSQLDQQG